MNKAFLLCALLALPGCAAHRPARAPAAPAAPAQAPDGWWITVSSTVSNSDIGVAARFSPDGMTIVENNGNVLQEPFTSRAVGPGQWEVTAPKGPASLREDPPGALSMTMEKDRVTLRRATDAERSKLEEAARHPSPLPKDDPPPPPPQAQ